MEKLFELDFGRWEIILISILPALINIGIFLYVSTCLQRSRTNYAFSIFVLLLGLWQTVDGFTKFSLIQDTAAFWSRISFLFVLFAIPMGIVFILSFTKWDKKISNYIVFITLFCPAIFFSFCIIAGLGKYIIIRSDQWYWIVNPAPTIITKTLYSWISFEGSLTLTLLWLYHFKVRKEEIKRKQSLLLALGFSVPVIGGIISEVVFPLIFHLNDVPVTTALFTVFSITTLIAIKKYKLLDYSPKHEWDRIVEVMNEGLLIVNNQNKIMYANKMFCELLGYESDEIKEKETSQLFFNDPKTKQQIENLIGDKKNNRSGEHEIRLKTKSGEPVWVIMSTAPYRGRNGKVIGSISIQTNITERKKAEAEIKKLNEELEERVEQRTFELTQANVMLENETQIVINSSKIIAQKNKDMMDSLNYAKLIQNAIIHKKETLEKLLPQSFILNIPLNIVSGDFVRVEEKCDKILVALADCTGHGIPGAMMSMVGCTLLNEIVNQKKKIDPPAVLQLLDSSFKKLTKEAAAINDGMDVGFCNIDIKNMELNYAGAHRPLYMIRDNVLTEIKSDNLSIGGDHCDSEKKFTNHALTLCKNDTLYLFSDGYTDQFGGTEGKKFSTKRFKNLLISIQHLSMEEQEDHLKKTIIEWQGELSQIDDICVLGIRI